MFCESRRWVEKLIHKTFVMNAFAREEKVSVG